MAKRVDVEVPERLHRRLRRVAREQGKRSLSSVAREALARYVEDHEAGRLTELSEELRRELGG